MCKLTDDDIIVKKTFERNQDECLKRGCCPTCMDNIDGGIFNSDVKQTLYENSCVRCFLAFYPRNDGHVIIMTNEHFEDISELPPETAIEVMHLINAISNALILTLNAEKVYLCSMCDAGKINHFHVQLIPRYDGDVTGKGLFSKERGHILFNMPVIEELREKIIECL